MNNQQKSRNNRPNTRKTDQEKNYYNLKIMGCGYINNLESRKSSKNGDVFTACTVVAIIGEPKSKQYRYFNAIVSGKTVEDLLWQYQADIENENSSFFVQFCLNDIRTRAYEKNNGELATQNDSFLIGIQRIWIDGELEFEAPEPRKAEDNSNQYKKSVQNERSSKSLRTQNMPTRSKARLVTRSAA